LDRLLGLSLEAHDLEFRHVAARTLVVFALAIFLGRVAHRRMLGRNAAIDIVLLVVLGSVLSRGINGTASFFPTLGASLLLVVLHHLVAAAAFHSHRISWLVKGGPITLVRHGEPQPAALRRTKITDEDLDESLRLAAGIEGTGDVAEARLERNGTISVVRTKDAEPAPAARAGVQR
jgi:uncharacterized membrane protein YcaP (DUF421 family)